MKISEFTHPGLTGDSLPQLEKCPGPRPGCVWLLWTDMRRHSLSLGVNHTWPLVWLTLWVPLGSRPCSLALRIAGLGSVCLSVREQALCFFLLPFGPYVQVSPLTQHGKPCLITKSLPPVLK